MAEAKRPEKATEAPGKPSRKTSPEAPASSGAARSESTEARDSAALVEGADEMALLTAVLAKLSKEEAERHQQNLVLKGLTEAVTDLYQKIDEIPKPADQKTVQELATEMVRIDKRTGWRDFLWQFERRKTEHKDSKYHLPRPSIIGRTLHELGAFDKNHSQTAGPIFQKILHRGPQHLNELIKGYLKVYVRSDGTKDPNISGKLGKQIGPRVEILVTRSWVQTTDLSCWLTPEGQKLFDGWPDYEVRDDDLDCLGEFSAASTAPATKPTAKSPKT